MRTAGGRDGRGLTSLRASGANRVIAGLCVESVAATLVSMGLGLLSSPVTLAIASRLGLVSGTGGGFGEGDLVLGVEDPVAAEAGPLSDLFIFSQRARSDDTGCCTEGRFG